MICLAKNLKTYTDSLASPQAVRSIIEHLRSAVPEIIPYKDKELIRMLRAARHAQRYPATDTKRGRASRWKREDLLKVGTRLRDILERETSSHISVASFVDHYLRLLEFPADVTEALASGQLSISSRPNNSPESLLRGSKVLPPKHAALAPTGSQRICKLKPPARSCACAWMNC